MVGTDIDQQANRLADLRRELAAAIAQGERKEQWTLVQEVRAAEQQLEWLKRKVA